MIRPPGRAAPAAIALLTLLVADFDAAAAAAGGSPFRLSLDRCVPVSALDVDQLLALELDRNDPTRAPPEPGSDLQIDVDCVGGQLVRLTAERAGTRRQRSLRLYDVPPSARPRLLALGIVELVVSSADGAANAGISTAVATVSTSTAAAPPPPAPARWRIDAGGSMRAFTRNWGHAMWGGTAGVMHTWPGTHSAAAFHLALEASDQTASLGRVSAVVASGALSYHLFGGHGRWRYGLAPGLRLGWARLAGARPATEVRATSFTSWWAGPQLAARLDVALGTRAFAGAGVEAGKVLQSVRGVVGDQTEVELGGVWLSALIAVGLRL